MTEPAVEQGRNPRPHGHRMLMRPLTAPPPQAGVSTPPSRDPSLVAPSVAAFMDRLDHRDRAHPPAIIDAPISRSRTALNPVSANGLVAVAALATGAAVST